MVMSHHDVSDAGKNNPRTPKEAIGVHKIADAAHHGVIEAQALRDADCCKARHCRSSLRFCSGGIQYATWSKFLLLVPDADRNDNRVLHEFAGELVADPQGLEGGHVASAR